MYSSYAPLLATDEKTAKMEGVQYRAALSFDSDELEFSSKEEQEVEHMDEVIEAADHHHVVITELNMKKGIICSLVSLTRTANNAEKMSLFISLLYIKLFTDFR